MSIAVSVSSLLGEPVGVCEDVLSLLGELKGVGAYFGAATVEYQRPLSVSFRSSCR